MFPRHTPPLNIVQRKNCSLSSFLYRCVFLLFSLSHTHTLFVYILYNKSRRQHNHHAGVTPFYCSGLIVKGRLLLKICFSLFFFRHVWMITIIIIWVRISPTILYFWLQPFSHLSSFIYISTWRKNGFGHFFFSLINIIIITSCSASI